eukprot:snap_masked-scaffold_25-processed-gene-0.36-mRNA-1 protein AED:1.00 eAED:1.00 QI:0/0/0/0/1/1/2/0/484
MKRSRYNKITEKHLYSFIEQINENLGKKEKFYFDEILLFLEIPFSIRSVLSIDVDVTPEFEICVRKEDAQLPTIIFIPITPLKDFQSLYIFDFSLLYVQKNWFLVVDEFRIRNRLRFESDIVEKTEVDEVSGKLVSISPVSKNWDVCSINIILSTTTGRVNIIFKERKQELIKLREGNIYLFQNMKHVISNHYVFIQKSRFHLIEELNSKKHFFKIVDLFVQDSFENKINVEGFLIKYKLDDDELFVQILNNSEKYLFLPLKVSCFIKQKNIVLNKLFLLDKVVFLKMQIKLTNVLVRKNKKKQIYLKSTSETCFSIKLIPVKNSLFFTQKLFSVDFSYISSHMDLITRVIELPFRLFGLIKVCIRAVNVCTIEQKKARVSFVASDASSKCILLVDEQKILEDILTQVQMSVDDLRTLANPEKKVEIRFRTICNTFLLFVYHTPDSEEYANQTKIEYFGDKKWLRKTVVAKYPSCKVSKVYKLI